MGARVGSVTVEIMYRPCAQLCLVAAHGGGVHWYVACGLEGLGSQVSLRRNGRIWELSGKRVAEGDMRAQVSF